MKSEWWEFSTRERKMSRESAERIDDVKDFRIDIMCIHNQEVANNKIITNNKSRCLDNIKWTFF